MIVVRADENIYFSSYYTNRKVGKMRPVLLPLLQSVIGVGLATNSIVEPSIGTTSPDSARNWNCTSLDWFLLITPPVPSTVNTCDDPCSFRLDAKAVLIKVVSLPSLAKTLAAIQLPSAACTRPFFAKNSNFINSFLLSPGKFGSIFWLPLRSVIPSHLRWDSDDFPHWKKVPQNYCFFN